jgi:AbrB family looped-hinge helix DNA binding protein
MSEINNILEYKVEDIFEDIENDPENVNMKIPDEIAERMGWKPGDTLKFTQDNKGMITITKVKDAEE